MKTKTLRLPEDLQEYKVQGKKEDVEESTAMRQLIKLGITEYSVQLYKRGEITLREAAELSHVSIRRMVELLLERGIKGNITLS
jgi:predicted HTH domain antitoxin